MSGSKAKASLLIIEDDADLRANMALILKMEGFKVKVAKDGPAGLAMIRRVKPDLILCDILMPGLDGYSVMETVKHDPFLAKIPFLFVSALNDRGQVRNGMILGADDYLTKPFSADELLAAIKARLQRFAALYPAPVAAAKESAVEQGDRLGRLTRREREILLLVGGGLSSKEIARTLFISKKTVDVHRSRLMKKLGAANAVSLVSWARMIEQLQVELD